MKKKIINTAIETCTPSVNRDKKIQGKSMFFTDRRVTRISLLGCPKPEKSEKRGITITTLKPRKGMYMCNHGVGGENL